MHNRHYMPRLDLCRCVHKHGTWKTVLRVRASSGWEVQTHFPRWAGPLLAASVKLLQFALRASSASASAKELTERTRKPSYRPYGLCWRFQTATFWQCFQPWFSPSWKDKLTVPSVESLGQGRPGSCCHDCWLTGDGPYLKGHGRDKRKHSSTCLRHTKQVIIGCGGGFHQECTQPYSPVARWMLEVDIALNDEGQQCGNLDEASAIARVPRKGLVIWCGDHKETPGGLRKSDEARAFRRKLMRRPIALRHQVPPTIWRHSPSVCARCAWTPRGRTQPDFREVPGNPLD